eukprot:g6138.t1
MRVLKESKDLCLVEFGSTRQTLGPLFVAGAAVPIIASYVSLVTVVLAAFAGAFVLQRMAVVVQWEICVRTGVCRKMLRPFFASSAEATEVEVFQESLDLEATAAAAGFFVLSDGRRVPVDTVPKVFGGDSNDQLQRGMAQIVEYIKEARFIQMTRAASGMSRRGSSGMGGEPDSPRSPGSPGSPSAGSPVGRVRMEAGVAVGSSASAGGSSPTGSSSPRMRRTMSRSGSFRRGGILHKLTADESRLINRLFKAIDRNSDGHLERDELQMIFASPTHGAEFRKLFEVFGLEAEGNVSEAMFFQAGH